MPSQFSTGKYAIAECDRCGFRFKLKELKKTVIKTKITGLKVCPQCWDPDHPQLQLGMYPVNDPQAVRDPRPDLSYAGPYGSRNIQWGWAPVGGPSDGGLTPSTMVIVGYVGTVTVAVT
jgi:hypothetical protein